MLAAFLAIRAHSFRQNFAFNVAAGGAMAAYSFLSPLVFTRVLTQPEYSAYLIVMQLMPYLMLLAAPLQQLLAPRLAGLVSTGREDELAKAATAGGAALLAIAPLIVALAQVLVTVLPGLLNWSSAFAGYVRKLVLPLAGATAGLLPLIVVTGFASGSGDFRWENVYRVGTPWVALLLLVACGLTLHAGFEQVGLETVATCYVAGAGVTGLCLLAVAARSLPSKYLYLRNLSWDALLSLFRDATTSMWLQVAALVSTGAGLFIVSSVEPSKVAAFGISMSVMVLIGGISTALSGPLAVKISGISSAGGSAAAAETLIIFQRRYVLFLVCATLLVAGVPRFVWQMWVGERIGADLAAMTWVVAIANSFRLFTAPYTSAVLGVGRQSALRISATVEAVLALIAGIALGGHWGALGVAGGICVSGLARLVLTCFRDVAATQDRLPVRGIHIVWPWAVPRAVVRV